MDKVLPNSINAEKLVLGTIMTERNAFSDVADILTEECFYDEFNKKIFATIQSICESGERPDVITVLNEMSKKESVNAYELTLISQFHTFDLVQHALVLKEKWMRRKLFQIGNYFNSNCFTETEDIETIITTAESMITGMLQSSTSSIKTINDGLQEVYDNINRNSANEKSVTGSRTGFSYFDKRSGGLQPSDLVIIAGETSQGKTSLALSIALNMAKENNPIAIYSLEMSIQQLCARFTAMESGVSGREIMFSKLDAGQYEKVNVGIGKLCDLPVFIDDSSSSSLDNILSSIRYLTIKHGIKTAVIDYMQLVSVPSFKGNKEQQTAYIARRLKNTAKELKITIIALSQLSRDKINPYPSLARLRDSGQIEEAADIVMFAYRPEIYKKNFPEPFEEKETEGYAMIDVAKGRNIGVFKFLCAFDADITLFSDIHSTSVPFQKSDKKKNLPF